MENKMRLVTNNDFSDLNSASSEYTSQNHLSVKIIKAEERFDALSSEWNDLAEESNAHIFQTFEWQRIWWKYFGENTDLHQLHIILFRNRGQLVGIVPFFIDYYRFLGKILYRCLRLIGSKIMQDENEKTMGRLTYTDYLDLIIRPGFEEAVCEALYDYLNHSNDYDDIIMEELPEYSPLLNRFLPLITETEKDYNTTVVDSSVCPVAELHDTWDQFLSEMSSNARYQIRRFVKRASNESEKKIFDISRIQSEDQIGPAYDRLVNFHQKRWNDRGRPGAFAEKRMYDFYKEITLSFYKKGWLQIEEVTIPEEDDQCIASDLMFRFNQTIYLIQRGFDDDSSYAEYSPGKSLLYTVIKNAFENGLKTYDFLRGDESYKFRAATNVIQNKNVIIQREQKPGLRLFLFYHVIDRFIFLKRRFRFEWKIIRTYYRQRKLSSALTSYADDLWNRLTKRFRERVFDGWAGSVTS